MSNKPEKIMSKKRDDDSADEPRTSTALNDDELDAVSGGFKPHSTLKTFQNASRERERDGGVDTDGALRGGKG